MKIKTKMTCLTKMLEWKFLYMLSWTLNKSIFLQAFLESIGIVIMWIVSFIILILEVKSRRDLRLTYSNITTLQSQTQTTSVLAQIESQYSNLNNYGYEWLYCSFLYPPQPPCRGRGYRKQKLSCTPLPPPKIKIIY